MGLFPRLAALVGMIAIGALALAPSARADLGGLACIEDGDTLVIDGKRSGGRCVGGTPVRLLGIDAPELDQTCVYPDGRTFLCGRYAASFLLERTKDKVVTCSGNSHDPEGRLLATCRVGTDNLNAMMVREGWAIVDPRWGEKYARQQDGARQAERGLWGMTFDPPEVWRAMRDKKR